VYKIKIMIKYFIFTLLIAILPLRSLAVVSMGLKMVHPHQVIENVTDENMNHCEMMLSAESAGKSQSEQSGKLNCQVCSLCMVFAYPVPSISMSEDLYRHQLVVRDIRFIDSTSIALPFKPPIS
jgi:hypothetical protein